MIFFFFNDTATTEIYTLSLHDALPIFAQPAGPVGSSAGGSRGKADWWGARGRTPGAARIRFRLPGCAAARGAAELDRLQKGRRDGEPTPASRGETQLPRACERRRIEPRIAARLGDLARLRCEPAYRVADQPEHHIAFDFLVVQPRRILDRRVPADRDRRA